MDPWGRRESDNGESAIGIHVSPLFLSSLPPPSHSHPIELLQSPNLSSLES